MAEDAAAVGEDKAAGGTHEAYEEEHVHAVYEQIATHFSATRYKPWPIIERFLRGLPAGAVGLDVGCGNGKYLGVNPDVFIVGSDRSARLAGVAAAAGAAGAAGGAGRARTPAAVVVADILDLPHPPRRFDFALAIAVIHHLSTPARRVAAIRSVLGALRPPADDGGGSTGSTGARGGGGGGGGGGRALLYVWALEQEGSRRGWTARDAQDVMVPWVMRAAPAPKKKKTGAASPPSPPPPSSASPSSASPSSASVSTSASASAGDRTFHRYYHLYREGELEADVRAAGGRVLDAGYEKDNWWAVAGVS